MNRWQQTDRTEEIIKNRIAANVPESKIVNKKIDKAYEKIRAMQAAAETASGRQSAQNAHRQTNKRTGSPVFGSCPVLDEKSCPGGPAPFYRPYF